MKKLTLLPAIVCLFTFTMVNAQMEKGKIITGLSSTIHLSQFSSTGTDILGLGFVTTKYEDSSYKTSYFNLSPRAGYFIIDNLSVGLDIVISTYTEKDVDDDDKTTETVLSAGPFVRYYYPLKKCYPFAELGFNIGSYKNKYNYGSGDNEEKAGITTIGGGIGAAFPLGDRVTFDVMAGYTNVTAKEKDGSDNFTVKTGGIGFKMGFAVFFSPM